MRFSYRMVDLASGDTEDVEIDDPSAPKAMPVMSVITETLALEKKFDPVFFSFGPPSRPGEPRPVAIIVDEESIETND